MDQERYTPNQMGADAQALLDRLIPERDAETGKRKRKDLSSRIKAARIMRNWAKTGAGYVS
jgi:hypothetical protein